MLPIITGAVGIWMCYLVSKAGILQIMLKYVPEQYLHDQEVHMKVMLILVVIIVQQGAQLRQRLAAAALVEIGHLQGHMNMK